MTTDPPPRTVRCDWFWGSHGCDMEGGHEGTIHGCGTRDPDGPCCQYDTAAPPDKRVRFAYEDQPDGTPRWDDWGPYGEGFGMGPDWGGPNITPSHTHAEIPVNALYCPACQHTQTQPNAPQPEPERGDETS